MEDLFLLILEQIDYFHFGHMRVGVASIVFRLCKHPLAGAVDVSLSSFRTHFCCVRAVSSNLYRELVRERSQKRTKSMQLEYILMFFPTNTLLRGDQSRERSIACGHVCSLMSSRTYEFGQANGYCLSIGTITTRRRRAV